MTSRRWTTSAAFAAVQMTLAQLMLVLALGLAPLLLPKSDNDRQMYFSAILFALAMLLSFKAFKQEFDGRNLLRLCLMMVQALPGLITTLKIAGWANRDPYLAPAIFGWPLAGLVAVTLLCWLGLTATNRWRPKQAETTQPA